MLDERAVMEEALTIAAHYITDLRDCKFFLAQVILVGMALTWRWTVRHLWYNRLHLRIVEMNGPINNQLQTGDCK
jgi:hypothetical protein